MRLDGEKGTFPISVVSKFADGEQATNAKNVTKSANRDDDPSLAWKRDGNSYEKGPDQLLPSSATYTWHADGAVKLNTLGKGDPSQTQSFSVPRLLETAAEKTPERTALAVKRHGSWQTWTYKKYLQDVRTAAKGFIALGLEPLHSVCILGFNAPEWVISDLAAIYAGGFAAGIYTTNSSESCAFVAKDSRAQIFVVEDDEQLEKILRCKDHLPDLKAIVQYSGKPSVANVFSWSELMRLGKQQSDNILNDRLKHIAINQCCTLIYTSGTTGKPKGVMLSHDNLTWSGRANCSLIKGEEEKVVSFLPLSHVAAQLLDIYCVVASCSSLYFADRNAFKGSLVETMKEVQPTIFLSVPRVWEKMYEKMQEVGKSVSWPKKLIAGWAKSVGMKYNTKRMEGAEIPKGWALKIAEKFVLSKIKDALGLSQARIKVSAGASIKPEILEYFMSLNILVAEIYGMSECSGTHCFGLESEFRLGSVGKTILGGATKLLDRDNKGNGEICLGGRHVLMGYLNQPEMTTDAIDQDGWLHSGDIGKMDKDGYLYVTGRIKELVITAGGENVAPVPIENYVKTAIPIVSQAMVVGDKRKFLSILLTLKTEVDKDTMQPLDTLHPFTKEWISDKGDCLVNTVQDVLDELYETRNSKLISAFQWGIDEANAKAVSHAQVIQKWQVLPVDFSIPGGEFGPTLKLIRSVVSNKYKHIIDKLYC